MGKSYHVLDLGGGIPVSPKIGEIYPQMQFPVTRIVAKIYNQGMS